MQIHLRCTQRLHGICYSLNCHPTATTVLDIVQIILISVKSYIKKCRVREWCVTHLLDFFVLCSAPHYDDIWFFPSTQQVFLMSCVVLYMSDKGTPIL